MCTANTSMRRRRANLNVPQKGYHNYWQQINISQTTALDSGPFVPALLKSISVLSEM